MFSAAPMDRLGLLGYPNDAEVDALLSQLGDESLLKLKVNTHNTSSRGFEYPTFTDGWMEDDATEALDTQLASRFSSLKRPIAPAKKKGRDSGKGGKKVFDSDGGLGGKNGSRDLPTAGAGKKTRDSRSLDRRAGDSDSKAGLWKGDEEESESFSSFRGSFRRREDGSSSWRHPVNREGSRGLSQRSEFLSFRSSDDPAAADEDPDSIDAHLNERFRALKAPSPPALPHSPSSTTPSTQDLGLDKIIQISGQLYTSDYDAYTGSPFSTSSSPSANLLGRSKSRSSPRVMTSSVATSCHCTTPSPLKLLKQVGSKSFPSRQHPSPGSLPPLSPAPRASKAEAKKAARDYKVEGFGNSKPAGKEGDEKKSIQEKKKKLEKKKSGKGESKNNTNSSPSTVKDMRRLLSSVADRVGLERSRVSSAVDDEFLGEDLTVWSVLDDEDKEFATAASEEERLNREAERVVEWAKDAARLGTGESDMDSEADVDDLRLDEADGTRGSDEGTPSKKGKLKKKIFKVGPPKKKTWGLF